MSSGALSARATSDDRHTPARQRDHDRVLSCQRQQLRCELASRITAIHELHTRMIVTCLTAAIRSPPHTQSGFPTRAPSSEGRAKPRSSGNADKDDTHDPTAEHAVERAGATDRRDTGAELRQPTHVQRSAPISVPSVPDTYATAPETGASPDERTNAICDRRCGHVTADMSLFTPSEPTTPGISGTPCGLRPNTHLAESN